ncbi:MAG: protein kinase [Gammaproteobacteria bacterium]|nr:protein kinase [Gammaproteobacteria bacterium]
MKNHRILIGITAVAALWASYTLPMQAVEQSALDWLSRFIPATKFASHVAVVAVDQKAIDSVGPWPWSYQTIAQLLTQLDKAHLKSVGLLLPFSHSENYLQKLTQDAGLQHSKLADTEQGKLMLQSLDFDQRLEQALKKSGNAVLPIYYQSHPWSELKPSEGRELPNSDKIPNLTPQTAQNAEWLAKLPWLFTAPTPELAITTIPQSQFFQASQKLGLYASNRPWTLSQRFMVKINKNFYPSVIGQMAMQILGAPAKLVTGYGININNRQMPTDSAFRFLPSPSVDNKGSLNIPTVSAADVLNGRVKKLPKDVQAAVIGLTTAPVGYASNFTAYGHIPASPAIWTAHSLNAFLNNKLIKYPYWSQGVQRIAIVLLAIYLLLLPTKLRGWIGFAITALLAVLVMNTTVLMLLVVNFYQPLVLPAIFVIFAHLLLTIHFKISHAFKSLHQEAANAYRELGLNLQAQGRLDEAFNYMRKCEMDNKLIECLYNLGLEFERRRQFNQAVAVYDYIAQKDIDYRDIQERRERHQVQSNRNMLTTSINSHTATLVVDHPSVARPVLGRYQVEKVIGQGAMGTVYLGVDPKISRMVAIKALPLSDEFDSRQIEEVRKRFYREAETAGRLNHPNIVTIFDVGEEHDLAYIAMDFINGEGLDNFGHPENLLSIDDVFHIGITVAEALDYAHQQNVVHRDIKPGNIIYDQQSGNLKITDFGIACLTDNSRTRTGTVLGSPSYMSPEQLSGEQVDGRSDLYSLGVTLYQLFTGVLPFTADSMASLAYKIANNKPQGIRKIRSELPTCLTRVINKSLEKNPEMRYQTGAAFADALRRCSKR